MLTDEQLKKKVNLLKKAMSVKAPTALKKQKKHVGKEEFYDTDEGKVRVLTYRMDESVSLPLYVNIHGGGFVLGNAEMDDPFMMNVAENADVKIISIDYSLAPDFPFPKAINECYAVIKYAIEHSDELGIIPDKIAVGGHSAGGNFSAAICLMDHERKLLNLKAAILDYPPMDVYTDAAEKPQPKGSLPIKAGQIFDACYLNDKEARKNPLISPIFASIEQVSTFPPTLVITAKFDSLCDEAEKFKDKLIEAGVQVTHKRFDAKHGFNLKPGEASDESWQMIINHLKNNLHS